MSEGGREGGREGGKHNAMCVVLQRRGGEGGMDGGNRRRAKERVCICEARELPF